MLTKKPVKPPKENIWQQPPSKKLLNFVIVFRIGIAVVTLLSLLLAGGCSDNVAMTQKRAELVEQAIATNTYLTSQEKAEVITTILDPKQELVLVDYHNLDICGLQGCLYNLYLHGEKIWSEYLQPELPPKKDLFTLKQQGENKLPCLEVSQYSYRSLLLSTYCYNGETYSLTDSFFE